MRSLSILLLEDNPLDVAVILKTLAKLPFDTDYTITSSANEYIEKLNQHNYDLILSDYQLPNFDAVKALRARNEKNSSIPFILITGAISDEVAVLVLKEGADDYILKDRMQRLPFAVEKLIRKQQIKSDKESVETSLSELTQRFQLASKASFDVIWDYNIEKDEVYCSSAIEKIIGPYAKENFQLSYLKSFIHPDDLSPIKKSFLAVVKGKENRWRKIFRVVRKDGSVGWVNINALILRDRQEKAARVTGVLHDVTEVRRLQHQLIEQELQNQKQITEITIEAQEKERMEIGKELHDNVNQLLATAKIMIDTARNIPEMHDLCLSKSQESIMDAINELRGLAHSMMPPAFEKNDFENILFDLAYKINLTGRVDLKLSLPEKKHLATISNHIKLAFYRIIQEQMSNILKYSRAKNAFIVINTNAAFHELTIEDDGIGFSPEKRYAGIGLKNIESRCSLLGGIMNLVSSPGNGCMIRIELPANNTVYV